MSPSKPLDELTRRFIAARERSGLTQEQAAQELGLSVASMSRKELGKQPVTSRDVAAMERIADGAPRLVKVPRGTLVAREPVARYNAKLDRIQAFERQMIRLGADDFEADHVRERARAFVEAIHSQGGTDIDEELELYLEASLKPWVVAHMKRRGAKPKEVK
jgi:transcriptional regulator with XRE-family HTH domain